VRIFLLPFGIGSEPELTGVPMLLPRPRH
jgi:hypothetical protein